MYAAVVTAARPVAAAILPGMADRVPSALADGPARADLVATDVRALRDRARIVELLRQIVERLGLPEPADDTVEQVASCCVVGGRA